MHGLLPEVASRTGVLRVPEARAHQRWVAGDFPARGHREKFGRCLSQPHARRYEGSLGPWPKGYRMRLVASPDNPVPQGGLVQAVLTADGRALRVARWPVQLRRGASGPGSGSIIVCQGRSEFIEKYYETIAALLQRSLGVVAFDWRGQGLSERELANPRKGHIDDYALYERDMAAVLAHMAEAACPKPWFVFAHSMGGAVMLRMAQARTLPVERMVLSAPLIGIHGLRWPRGASGLAAVLDGVGLGGAYIPGGGGTSIVTRPFEGNVLTADAARYARNAAIVAAAPELGLGDPTIGWLNASFRQMHAFEAPEFARSTLLPTLIAMAGRDRVVANAPMERFASHMKAGMLVAIPLSEHEILQESDAFRSQFWAAFDAFIPGTRAELNALEQQIALRSVFA